MDFFNNILNQLGIDSAKAETAPLVTAAAPAPVTPAPATSAPTTPAQSAAAPSKATPKTAARVDVVAQLEQRAAANSQKLNWRTSIVDLLKLLEIDSSLTARKQLATELNCPAELMADSANMNMWLHKTVLARIAENGGNVPAELLN